MQLHVQTPCATKTTITVELDAASQTVDGIKAAVHRAAGIPVEHQRLLFDGTELCDSSSLSDYEIQTHSTVKLGAVKLVDFPQEAQGSGVLAAGGVAVLEQLPAPLYPVSLMGIGRAGKSFVASIFAGEDGVFKAAPAKMPVTKGIDVWTCPMPDGQEGTLVLLDCEGGNNAMEKHHHSQVDLLAMLGSSVVYVSKSFDNTCIDVIDGSMTAKQLQLISEPGAPKPALHYVVNLNMIADYDGNELEQKAAEHPTIQQAFAEFHGPHTLGPKLGPAAAMTTLLEQDPEVQQLRHAVIGMLGKSCKPVSLGGVELDGAGLVEVFGRSLQLMGKGQPVARVELGRHVLERQLISPLLARFDDSVISTAGSTVRSGLGPEEYVADLSAFDPRQELLDELHGRLPAVGPVIQWAESRLSGQMLTRWSQLSQTNDEHGQQVVSVETGTRQVETGTKRVEVGRSGRRYGGFFGPRDAIHGDVPVYRTDSRTRTHHRNGTIGEWSAWSSG